MHNPYAGPLSRQLWEKAHSIRSHYPDTFDYGIYDRLVERFDANPPQRSSPRRTMCLNYSRDLDVKTPAVITPECCPPA